MSDDKITHFLLAIIFDFFKNIGYLITNILDTGKGFYIGEEKVQEFIDYLTENCKGYQIVYIDTTPNANEEETNLEDDKIMMYDKATNTVTEVDMNSIRGESNSASSSVNYTEAFDPTKVQNVIKKVGRKKLCQNNKLQSV